MELRLSQGIQTQQPIKDLSPSRPAFCHLDIHTFSAVTPKEERWWDSFCIRLSACLCVCVSLSNTIILSCFLFVPHWLINHSWEQRGASIDSTDIPLGGKLMRADILSHPIHPSNPTPNGTIYVINKSTVEADQHRWSIILHCELFHLIRMNHTGLDSIFVSPQLC